MNEKNLVSDIKSEAQYLELQLKKYKERENKIIDLMNIVYHKLEKSIGLKDPEMKIINKEIREILTQKTLQPAKLI